MKAWINTILIILLSTLILGNLTLAPVSAQPEGIGAIGWNGEHWLIGTFRINCNRWALIEYDGASFPDLTEKFTGVVSFRVAPEPPQPPPPHTDGRILIVLATLIFGFLIILIILLLIWKAKSKGARYGAVWGLIGPILYWVLVESKLFGIKTVLQIIALPLFIYSKISQSVPGGSFYYSPIIVFPFSILVGAVIGYGVEKVYRRVRR